MFRRELRKIRSLARAAGAFLVKVTALDWCSGGSGSGLSRARTRGRPTAWGAAQREGLG